MSEQFAIDGLEFARQCKHLEGDVSVTDMPRLRELLISRDGVLHYDLSGGLSDLGKPRLYLDVAGGVLVECQRCLEPLELAVKVSAVLELVEDQSSFVPVEEEEDSVDMIPADSATSVLALVEDEVLLSLPVAPVHPHDVCHDPGFRVVKALEKVNPFKVLASLKKNI